MARAISTALGSGAAGALMMADSAINARIPVFISIPFSVVGQFAIARSRLSAGSGRLKGGCGQDWPPSKTMLYTDTCLGQYAPVAHQVRAGHIRRLVGQQPDDGARGFIRAGQAAQRHLFADAPPHL